MPSQTDNDPLSRALAAFGRLHGPDSDATVREELEAALVAAQAERAALLAVALEAGELVDAIAAYENAAEAEQSDSLDPLAQACVEAEEALVDALNHVHEIQSGEAELSGKQGYLTALERFADDGDEEPRQ
jgi:aminopeptidase N